MYMASHITSYSSNLKVYFCTNVRVHEVMWRLNCRSWLLMPGWAANLYSSFSCEQWPWKHTRTQCQECCAWHKGQILCIVNPMLIYFSFTFSGCMLGYSGSSLIIRGLFKWAILVLARTQQYTTNTISTKSDTSMVPYMWEGRTV